MKKIRKVLPILFIIFIVNSCGRFTENTTETDATENMLSSQAETESEAQVSQLPFTLQLPEGTTLEWDSISNIWRLISDREGELNQYGNGRLSEIKTPGWIDSTKKEDVYINALGYPFYMQNHCDAYNYEEYDFGLLCTWECDAYVSSEIVAYSIPEEDWIASFWNVIIFDEKEDTYYWLFFQQKCFTKEEVLQIAESISL